MGVGRGGGAGRGGGGGEVRGGGSKRAKPAPRNKRADGRRLCLSQRSRDTPGREQRPVAYAVANRNAMDSFSSIFFFYTALNSVSSKLSGRDCFRV